MVYSPIYLRDRERERGGLLWTGLLVNYIYLELTIARLFHRKSFAAKSVTAHAGKMDNIFRKLVGFYLFLGY